MTSDFSKVFGLVFAAMSLIVIGDAAGKVLTQHGASPFFVGWTRFAIAALLLLPFSGLTRSELPQLGHRGILLRSALISTGICLILTALRTEPIANVFGAFFVGPVVAYILSVLILKERVTPVRTFLLLLGFGGVLLVVQPGFGMSRGLIFAALAGCSHGAYLVATRAVAGQYRLRFLLISQLMFGAIALAPLGLSASMPEFSYWVIGLITISAFGSASGNYILVMVNRTTPASLIAPLIYTQLIAATISGYVFFGDWPDIVRFLGLSIILASGMMSLWFAGRGR